MKKRKEPTPHPDCADNGVNGVLVDGKCEAWVVDKGHCHKDWAISDCEESCGICRVCTPGKFGDWSACTSTCGGGGQYRTQDPGDCGDDFKITEQQQCETQNCDPGDECTLSPSPPLLITEDNAVHENLLIKSSGKEAAILLFGAANVVLRNIKIVHEGSARNQYQNNTLGIWLSESGEGIYFRNAPNILIENVHVSLVRPSPNPFASDSEVCAKEYCGPFPFDMRYAYNIWGQYSDSPTLSNVYVTGGSTGFWCQECPDGKVSHYKAENLHGPFPRGQCFQVVSSPRFVIEDFTCVQDNEIAFPEDDVSLWNSSYAIARRGLIKGGNAPNGVGIIMEMSDNVVVEDVDVTLVGGTCFSAYGAKNVTFLRTRAKDNHADGGCLEGKGYCKDMNGNWPNSITYVGDETVPDKTCCGDEAEQRCDTKGGIWFAGDYTADQAGGKHTGMGAADVAVKQGVFYGMTAIESEASYSNVGTCVDINMDYWATSAANRQESYILKDFKEEDFTLREPFEPTFCFPVV
jgi:hypothetical protein